MNKMLERAIAQAVCLPEDEQETLASLMMEEMESERAWDESFANSQDKLGELARKAKAQHARGETTPLVFPADP
ncbi:MAG: hypothetical protein A2516_11290 [Alphaproteobacteria bacterium RIFOXYD12_FULL_60_8]|nr:MAG: hypothetical protein A2516_11290 [Alphaproteobacteria bacterium RIFOXYD12_FULL_60_8]